MNASEITSANIDVSIVIPVYYNEGSISKTVDTIINQVVNKNQKKFEIIIVDDGSLDNSLLEILECKKRNNDLIKVIKLTRNFGQLSAILAGYSITKGKCIVNISADLQDPPELINQMINYHFNDNFEIVICTREDRDENFIRRGTSKIFYRIIKKLSFKNMPEGGFDFALVSSTVKKFILMSNEANAFWQGQILWTGYPVKFIPYKRLKREIGRSQWTFSKKMKLLIDGVMSYSYFPLRAMIVFGGLTALLGFIYAIVIIIAKFFGNVPFKGWAPIMILVLVLSGIQMLMLGLIGEYLWRTLDQVRKRPLYLIEKIID